MRPEACAYRHNAPTPASREGASSLALAATCAWPQAFHVLTMAARTSVSPQRSRVPSSLAARTDNPFTPRLRDAGPAGAPSVADAASHMLCELNGLLVGTEHAARMALPAAAWLPLLPGGSSAGFGLETQPAVPGPTTRLNAPLRRGVLDEALVRLRMVIGIEPPPLDAGLSSRGAKLLAFAWQPHAMSLALPLRLLGAAALPDDSIALYDTSEQGWSPHRLVNLQQKRVVALAWQPLSYALLAAACARGVCVWRLTYSADGTVAGAQLQRVIELPPDLEGLPHPPRLLAWHPLGQWLAATSPRHARLTLCDPAAAAPAAHMPTGATSALGFRAKVLHALTGVAATGVGVLEVSPCGGLLAAAGAAGGIRIWETRSWSWESRPTLGDCAPCIAAAWHGPPPLGEGARTLLLALQGSPSLHVLRFGKRVLLAEGSGGAAAAAVRSEYLGIVDLASLGKSPQLRVLALAWEPRGERLVIAWSAGGDDAPGGAAAPPRSTHVQLVHTQMTPSLQLHPVGQLEENPASLGSLSFAARLGDGSAGGAVVSAAWANGIVRLTPLFF